MIVYVLKCENDMYYIGSTYKKLISNFDEIKNVFTSKYKPISIIFSKKTYNIFEEDILVKKYMIKYGINKVRGGFYSSLNLSKSDINRLKKEIISYNKGCFKCGREIHFDNKCHEKVDIYGNNIVRRNMNTLENKYREEYNSGNDIKTIVKSVLNCFT